ncbi:GNAT family N-acetyltransferase [Flagellimonas sp.]|uniref:GNAT family N-acetyltransferase n=1 Tax=Flagellimonas sp. TaxID=2058762 RepID=UPI003BB0059B
MDTLNQEIVAHLFEFWSEIGNQAEFTKTGQGYTSTLAPSHSWPSKVFITDSSKTDFEYIQRSMQNGILPNSLSIGEDKTLIEKLKLAGFKETSRVKAMCLLSDQNHPRGLPNAIVVVRNSKHALEFATTASKAFGYTIHPSTINALLGHQQFHLYLGMHLGTYASCGMVYFDGNGNSGIHMIGVLPIYRGLGLGKRLTQALLSKAGASRTKKVFLVASQLGEPIYAKLGFETYGSLVSFRV